jgi:nucleotide-binding universal stress UspA family protein
VKIERLLIATTGSTASREAVDLGLEIAAALGADVFALSVVPLDDPRVSRGAAGPLAYAVPHALEPGPQDVALAHAHDLARELGVSCRLEVIAGESPGDIIASAAQRHRADLVVVSGQTPRARWVGRLTHRLKMPVLVAAAAVLGARPVVRSFDHSAVQA